MVAISGYVMANAMLWHKILPTRKMLKICKIIDDDRCSFCKQAVETALHLIILCPKVKTFWDQIWRAFRRANIKYRITELTNSKIMFGIHEGGNYDLNLFLLLTKWFIWRQSKNEKDLVIRLYLNHLPSFQRVQSCVYTMEGKRDEFKRMWSATAKMMDMLAS